MDGTDHLIAQLAHSEDDDRRLEVDVGGGAEHATEAAGDPAMEDERDARACGQALGDVGEHRLRRLVVRPTHGALHERALRFVEPSADARAEVDDVRGRGPEPFFVAVLGRAKVQDVQGVAGAESQSNVDAAELLGQAAVLMLGVDDEDLDAHAQRSDRERREEVRLAGAGVAEDADIGVGVAALVEGIDEHRRAGRPVATGEQSARLLEVRLVPGKEGDKRCRVDDALALEAVRAAGARGEEAVEHPEGAGSELAEHRAGSGLDTSRAGVELVARGRCQGQVSGDVEGLVLAGGEPALQVLGVRQGSGQGGVGGAGDGVEGASGAHVDELALQVADDPRRRQRGRVPRKVKVEFRR
ncbi:MAG TPA: hypothetical protein VJR46_14195 [Candidatus Dormibacteraeota bacterium]|nr:hypothetical protein [Candidatus Dormibacteraeota bacterium]